MKLRLCIFCKYFYFSSAEPGYSEYTPGSDASLGCYKGRWQREIWDIAFDWHEAITTAETCLDWQVSAFAAERGVEP